VGQEGGGIDHPAELNESHGTALAAPVQLAVMAAIVATLVYFPLGLALVLALRVAGIGFETLATFGGVFGLFFGLVVWWLLIFAGALAYAACLFPWRDKVLGWPKKN
jgi:Na+/H+-dicarboxylate symporter